DFYNGTSWAIQGTGGSTDNLHALAMVSTTKGWASGKNGNIYVWNSTAWSTQASPWTLQDEGMTALDANHAIIVGSGGQMSITSDGGTTWKAPSAQYIEFRFGGAAATASTITSTEATFVY